MLVITWTVDVFSIGTMPEYLLTVLQDLPTMVCCWSRSRESYRLEIVDIDVNFCRRTDEDLAGQKSSILILVLSKIR